MIRWIFLLSIFLINNDLKVLSYNIRYNNPNDGVNHWENRKQTIANFINEENPDFAGLQEVTHSQLEFLLSNLIDYDYVGVGRDDGKQKGEYSPIFFDSNKFSFLKGDTFWLSETPNSISVGWDASMERICTYGLFEERKLKRKIFVFNTHFDHVGDLARKNSAVLLIKKIKELNVNDYPVILTGDFNLDSFNETIKLLQTEFIDSNKNIKIDNKYYGTYTGFKLEAVEPRRIDYIFFKNLILKSSRHIHLKTEKKLWASDHHPVLTLFKIN